MRTKRYERSALPSRRFLFGEPNLRNRRRDGTILARKEAFSKSWRSIADRFDCRAYEPSK
jgi:hypothetical protein